MNRECWTEMDLYWFQGAPLGQKVQELFDRLEPIWQREPGARKGISLCCGWLFDSILFWNGDLDAPIVCCQPPLYERWTYRRLGELLTCLKGEAAKRGISDFHTVMFVMGVPTNRYDEENECTGWLGRTDSKDDRHRYQIDGYWFPNHPEITDEKFGAFDFGLPVHVPPDEGVCDRENPTFGEYFADKLCGLAASIDLDGLVFRDRIFTPAYVRGNRNRYMAPEDTAYWTGTFMHMFAEIKAKLPAFLVIGYDSGTSSMEEWRSHGFDLERLACTGHLDLWITQTWASAWQDYWVAHSMGFTFQLTNVLANMAMLAHTSTKHLFLIETFDAWEPWDTIHQFPGKLSWEIWAYSHATLLLQEGASKRTDGCYMSWMNRGPELLSEEAVNFVVRTMNEAAADLARHPLPGGPCLIYHRQGLEALLASPATYSRGEEMDDWTSMLLKFGVPVLSITRSEWLGSVTADAFIFPSPAHMEDELSDTLYAKLQVGTPVLFTGQASLLSEKLRNKLELAVLNEPQESEYASAATIEQQRLVASIGTSGVAINQRVRTLADSTSWETLIRCLEGPVFAAHRQLPCWIWETPEWGTPYELHLTVKSIQSPQTYHAIALAFGEHGWGIDNMKWTNADWQKPIAFLFWRYAAGGAGVLLGNLETGTTGSSQFAVTGQLACSEMHSYSLNGLPSTSNGKVGVDEGSLKVSLAGHKAGLLSIDAIPFAAAE